MILVLREEQQALCDEQLRDGEDQLRSRDDMTRLLDAVREMAVVVTRLEKRPVVVKTLVEASKLAHAP